MSNELNKYSSPLNTAKYILQKRRYKFFSKGKSIGYYIWYLGL